MGSFFANLTFDKKGIDAEKWILPVKKALIEADLWDRSSAVYLSNDDAYPYATLYSDALELSNPEYENYETFFRCMKTKGFYTCCIDSDVLLLTAFAGGSVSEQVVGFPDDYGLEIEPDTKAWNEFLNREDLPRFEALLKQEYVFAEEALDPLSALIPFDPEAVNCRMDEIADLQTDRILQIL